MDEELRAALSDLRGHFQKMDAYVKEHGYGVEDAEGLLNLMKEADLAIVMTSTLLRVASEERRTRGDESCIKSNLAHIDNCEHSIKWREKDVEDIIRHRKEIEKQNGDHLVTTREIFREGFRQIADAILKVGEK